MERFEISTRPNGEYQFCLKTSDNEVIITSEDSFRSFRDCNNAILNVRKAAIHESAFEKQRTHDGHFFFRIRTKTGDVAGVSRLFDGELICNNYIQMVQNSIVRAAMTEY